MSDPTQPAARARRARGRAPAQEPLFWATLLFTLIAVAAAAWGGSAAEQLGAPFPPDLIQNSLLPIFAPVLVEMVAFFFLLEDPGVRAAGVRAAAEGARARTAEERAADATRARVAWGCAVIYGVMPTAILLWAKTETLPASLSTFHLVAQPIFAYVIVYYFGRKLKAAVGAD